MSDLFSVGVSTIAGRGVFAEKDIPAGTTICFMEGEEVPLQEIADREIDGRESAGDALQVDDETYIDMEEKYRSINHSCDPNAGIRGRNELVVIKPIRKGEEITFDYSTTMWEDAEQVKRLYDEETWSIPCACGAAQCRKEITDFYKLPRKLQEKYVLLRAVPDYILKKMKRSIVVTA